MKKYIFTFLSPFFLIAQEKFEFVKKIPGYHHPECVCIVDENHVFVADIGKEMKPSERDSDGVIYKCTIQNPGEKVKFNKGFKLNAPKGIVADKKYLYVTDIDRIVIMDIETGEKTDEIPFSDKTVFLNDVVFIDETSLLTTATNQHEIYAVILGSKEIFDLSHKSLIGANGLYPMTNKVYICGFSAKNNKDKGDLFEYDIEANKVSVLVPQMGHLDGLKMRNGKLIISDWGGDFSHGKIWEFDPATNKSVLLSENEALKSPSDFDILQDTMLIPCLDTGELILFKWSK